VTVWQRHGSGRRPSCYRPQDGILEGGNTNCGGGAGLCPSGHAGVEMMTGFRTSGFSLVNCSRTPYEPKVLQEALDWMPSKIPQGETRGWIVPIGGAENKENDRHILERFIRVSGGTSANIVVIPTASRMHETGPRYEKLFQELGADQVAVMDFDTRRDCQEAGRLRRIEEATGIFFTGGNQLRVTTLLGGTPVAKLIRTRNAHGVTVGGTSAGASILSEHMIAFGDEGSSVISGSVRLAPGLGLTNRFIIDQHFRQRDRLGRLITALAYNPFAVGIGLDEDTAAFIGPDETIEVEGSGGVTVVDASEASYSSMGEVDEGQPVCMLGLRLHILVAGATFNLHTRLAAAGGLVQPKE
jgi:cyanophycinase